MDRSCSINIIHFDGGALVEDPSLDFEHGGHPLTRLVEQVATRCMKLPRFQHVQTRYRTEEGGDTLEPAPGPFVIDLVLASNREVFDFWSCDRRALGMHCINSGAFEGIDETDLSPRHRVLVICDPSEARSMLIDERLQELDPHADTHDTSFLASYLITLTHELVHCIEFMENGNGWSPYDIQGMFEGEEIDLSVADISTGHGILFPFDPSRTQEDCVDIMEDRVEAAGRDLFHQLRLDDQLIRDALVSIQPSRREITAALSRSAASEPSLG